MRLWLTALLAALALPGAASAGTVFLLDGRGVVRTWNPAAEAITGLAADAVVGRPAVEVIPGWETVAPLVPVAGAPGPVAAQSVQQGA